MKKILFQDTSFRDGFQSVFGARALTDDFIGAVEAAAHAGITHFECGGGARFQSLFLYCGESAFDMMDRFRQAVGPEAHLQTLARGINVVALSAQPRDMIDLHAKMFKKHGVTHIRNFDALNDVHNLEYSGKCITDAGLHHQAVITMMELPPGCEGAHDADFYIQTLRNILDSGLPFDSICFKDASGTSNPRKVHATVKAARALLGDDVIIWMHTHETANIGGMQYLAAIEAGCDGICCSRAPVSGGTSQPDLLSMSHALKGSDYTLDIDVKKILEANSVFKEAMKEYFFPPEALKVSSEVIFSPMPGGALTANTMMMRDTGTLHLYPQVIDEMGICVAKGGFGTSVTPVSQFYFQQAYANVTQGRWKRITDGYGKMVLGYFGKTPVPPDPEVVQIAAEQLQMKPFTGDPLEVLEDGIPKARKVLETEGLPTTDENIFIVGALQTPGGNKGLDFLKGNFQINVRKEAASKGDKKPVEAKQVANAKNSRSSSELENYTVTVDGKSYSVQVQADSGDVTAVAPRAATAVGSPRNGHASNGHTHTGQPQGEIEVCSTIPANVYKLIAEEGARVKAGDPLLILEAMKMETTVSSPSDGVVMSLDVEQGQTVQSGELLLTLSK